MYHCNSQEKHWQSKYHHYGTKNWCLQLELWENGRCISLYGQFRPYSKWLKLSACKRYQMMLCCFSILRGLTWSYIHHQSLNEFKWYLHHSSQSCVDLFAIQTCWIMLQPHQHPSTPLPRTLWNLNHCSDHISIFEALLLQASLGFQQTPCGRCEPQESLREMPQGRARGAWNRGFSGGSPWIFQVSVRLWISMDFLLNY